MIKSKNRQQSTRTQLRKQQPANLDMSAFYHPEAYYLLSLSQFYAPHIICLDNIVAGLKSQKI